MGGVKDSLEEARELCFEVFGPQRVEDRRPVVVLANQARFTQNPEVMRRRGFGNRQIEGTASMRTGGFDEVADYLTPNWIRQGRQYGVQLQLTLLGMSK